MQQLPLSIRLRAGSVFESYWAGPNATAVELLENCARLGSPMVYLYGSAATGKTHLLQALCARASQRGTATYLPLSELQDYGPSLLAGCEGLDAVCLDDFGTVLGNLAWEQALFNLYRELEERGGKLVVADEHPPLALNFVLRDLASRVLAATVLRLQALDEAEQIQAFRLRAAQRGLELPDETIAYLLRRLPRDMHTLCNFLDKLDTASLVAQRRLTVPFVRDVLEREGSRAEF